MRDEEQRLLIVRERVLHPFAAGDVEMIRRLVKNEEVYIPAHEHAQAQAALLAAGERADRGQHILAAKAEGRETVARLLRQAAAVIEHRVKRAAALVREADKLREICRAYRGAEVEVARIGLFLIHDELHEGGFSRAVITDEGDALPAGDGQVKIGEELLFAVALGDAVHDKHLVTLEAALLELDGELLLLGRALGMAELFDALFHRESALVELVIAHEGPEMHLRRGALKLLYLCLILLVFLQLLLKAALPLLNVKAVVAGVKLRLAVDDFDRALDDAVKKIPVMADGEHRTLEAQKIVLQPLRRVQVEVVRRLIQQENVSVLKDKAREVHTGLFPAGERIKGLGEHCRGNIQTVCDAAALNVHLVPAEAGIVSLKLVILLQQLCRLVVFHLRFKLVHARGDGVDMPVRVAQHLLDRPALGVDGYL